MRKTEIKDAVQSGTQTATELADEFGVHYGHMAKVLKEMVEDGQLARESDGGTYVHYVPDETPAEAPGPASGDGDGLMPVYREYDFDTFVPDDVDEYQQHASEYDELRALIDNRYQTKEPVRGLIGGPTGAGKTTLVQSLAKAEGAPLFEIQMSYATNSAHLLGSPQFSGDETMWVDGTLTKAIMSSAERPTFLLIDEANRARPHTKAALYSALDHRARVVLEGPRGGEIIQGNSLDLIVLATINEGQEYHGQEKMDLAEKRRYVNRWDVDYLAPETETELIVERTPASRDLAERMVSVANSVRDLARDHEASRQVKVGVPTSAVLSWARNAYAFDEAGLSNPVMTAGRRTIVEQFYDGDGADEVAEIMRASLGNAPFEAEDYEDYATGEIFTCTECSWDAPVPEAKEMGVYAMGECPDCGGVCRVESGE